MKPIKGYEGLYSITKDGKVWSHARKQGCLFRRGLWVKSYLNRDGYPSFGLYKSDGSRHHKTAHRMLAEAFIPNLFSLPQINHKNSIRSDFRLENLEWCSAGDNIRHGVKAGNYKKQHSHEHLAKMRQTKFRLLALMDK